jgi:hypothetical protein
MKNPIPHVALFATWTKREELEEFAQSCDNPAQALQMLYLALNYCHHLVEHSLDCAHHAKLEEEES